MRFSLLALLVASALGPCAEASANREKGIPHNMLNELVVTGTNDVVPQKLLPYTVSVVNNRQLEATGQTQVLSAISGMVPSLFVSQRSIFGVRRQQWGVRTHQT